METKTTNKKAVGIAVAVLAVLLVLAGGIYYFTRPEAQEGAKTITVAISSSTEESSDPKTVDIKTDAENLLDAMIEKGLIKQEDYTPGSMIYTIDGVTADDNKREWWALMQNGELLNTGFADTLIADGETYEVKLSTY